MEAISFDSMQVYRSMPILTQAPPRSVTRKLKTHLVSILSPSEEWNAAQFREGASALIPKILKKGKTPFLVGGTGLYLRALLDGLFEAAGSGVASDEKLRRRLLREQELHGGAYLHDWLKRVDAASALRIHPNDLRRIIRALEVYELTGRPMSKEMIRRRGIREFYDCRIFFLDRERGELYRRIDRRVEKMIKEGLVGEVKKLIRKKLSPPAQMALGIREVRAYLEGRLSLEEAKELLKKNTRNYAKRQLSWFRHERGVENVPVLAADTPKVIANTILARFSP